jgi:hypothetical protein
MMMMMMMMSQFSPPALSLSGARSWEGGVRVEALVHSPLLPASRRGIKWSGLAHSSDW